MRIEKFVLLGSFLSLCSGQLCAEETPYHARVLKVLQSEPKDKQEEFITAILYQYQVFSSQSKISNLNLDRSRAGTFLLDLGEKDWNYVKAKVINYGLPSEQHARFSGTKVLIREGARDITIIDLANIFNGSVTVNEKEYPFKYKFEDSVQKNDEKFKKLFLNAQRREELFDSETVFRWSLIPHAHAASSTVVSPLRALSSSIGGLLRGFVSPVGGSGAHSGRVAAVDVNVGSGS